MSEFIPERILSSQLFQFIDSSVIITGWLHKKRELGQITFLLLRDRHGIIQIVAQKIHSEKLKGIHIGSILTIKGTAIAQALAPAGVEIHCAEISIDVPVIYPSPLEIDKPISHIPEHLDTLFEHKIITMRNVTESGIYRIQAAVGDVIRSYLNKHDFTEFHSPKLLAGSTEGGAEVFKLDYFGKSATLAQSAQFYKQILVGSLERVFEFGGTYRAEPSVTTRHMTEFITVDVEMGFITNISDIMNLINGMLIEVCDSVWHVYERELLALKARKPLIAQVIPKITLEELHELCFQKTQNDFRGEKDPSPYEERWICEYSAQEWKSEAVFITGFPAADMKFYHYRSEENPQCADRFDLLFRGVEIITGSRREHRYDKLIEQLKIMGLNPEDEAFRYYLQAFKYGMPPHGGFGLGLERLTQKIIGFNNVKEATLFPRDMNRLTP